MPKISTHAKTANLENRDQFGKFTSIKTPPQTPPIPASPNPPNTLNTPVPSNLITLRESSSRSTSDEVVNIKIKNPISMILNKLKELLNKQAIHASVNIPPLTAIMIALALAGGGIGLGYNIGFNVAITKFFPNSSPLLHRTISVQGLLQKGNKNQYFLTADNNTLWNLKLKNPADLSNLINTEVSIKGNLTSTPGLIENVETTPLEPSPTSPAPQSISEVEPTSQTSLTTPKLYLSLTWETEESKILTFTSGKRRVEIIGVHMESKEVKDFPQGFVDYYIKELTNLGFKQTLNSKDPDRIMETFQKEEKYFTFGIKNIFQGSGDNKKLVGYKAFIEHN